MLLVSLVIILPLSLLRNLGEQSVCVCKSVCVLYLLHTKLQKPHWEGALGTCKGSGDGRGNLGSVSSVEVLTAVFPATGYLGYTSGLSLLCMVFFLIVVSRTRRPSSPALCSLLLKRPFRPRRPGDHQEVPDPVSAASGGRSQRHREGPQHQPFPAERHSRGLQRERLHAKILCVQLPGEAPPLGGGGRLLR